MAGQQNKKVAFVIQARMKSTRLPGKILLPLPLGNGKPLLQWIVDELKKSVYGADIFVATSINPENDVLVPFCEQNNIHCFRGDEENVLSRFIAIAKQGNYDCIIRLTADNPIIDIAILDETITIHLKQANDYTRSEGLPVGMNFEIIQKKALLSLANLQLTDADKEHVTLFIKNSGLYKIGVYKPLKEDVFYKLRLTIDYASDYTLLSCVLTLALMNSSIIGMELVKHVYKIVPWLFESNISNIQKAQYSDTNDEMVAAINLLKKYDFQNAANLLTSNLNKLQTN